MMDHASTMRVAMNAENLKVMAQNVGSKFTQKMVIIKF